MEYIALGKTNLLVSRASFGTLALKDIAVDDAVTVLRAAYTGGINFFDTARSYGDSESKLGYAFYGMRKEVFFATKSAAATPAALSADIEASLEQLQTEYIDLLQIDNPSELPVKGGADGLYDALTDAKKTGKIRHIGIATESFAIASQAVKSGLYESVQYPFNIMATPQDIGLAEACAQAEVGFIAMKALCGGELQNIPLALGFMHQYENVIPVWGIRKEEEVQQILYFEVHPPVPDEKFHAEIDALRQSLALK